MKLLSTLFLSAVALVSVWGQESAKVRMEDNFLDGDLTKGTVWKSGNAKEPWQVVDNSMRPSGNVIFDSISTSDFAPVENGVFDLEFKVRFASQNNTGNNRFTVFLRDSNNRHAGYGATIAQKTSNNANLVRLEKDGKQAELARMKAADAFNFPSDGFATIRFSRDAEGKLQFWVDGKLRMEAVDKEFQAFDRVQFTCRCATPEEVQSFTAIRLK